MRGGQSLRRSGIQRGRKHFEITVLTSKPTLDYLAEFGRFGLFFLFRRVGNERRLTRTALRVSFRPLPQTTPGCMFPFRMVSMPQKFNADRRDKIPKQKYRVTNWADYNESLRRRSDLTVWVSEEGLGLWSAPRRTTRGGQQKYSDIAIKIGLTLGGLQAGVASNPRPDAQHLRLAGSSHRCPGFLYPLAPGRGPDFARDARNDPI